MPPSLFRPSPGPRGSPAPHCPPKQRCTRARPTARPCLPLCAPAPKRHQPAPARSFPAASPVVLRRRRRLGRPLARALLLARILLLLLLLLLLLCAPAAAGEGGPERGPPLARAALIAAARRPALQAGRGAPPTRGGPAAQRSLSATTRQNGEPVNGNDSRAAMQRENPSNPVSVDDACWRSICPYNSGNSCGPAQMAGPSCINTPLTARFGMSFWQLDSLSCHICGCCKCRGNADLRAPRATSCWRVQSSTRLSSVRRGSASAGSPLPLRPGGSL